MIFVADLSNAYFLYTFGHVCKEYSTYECECIDWNRFHLERHVPMSCIALYGYTSKLDSSTTLQEERKCSNFQFERVSLADSDAYWIIDVVSDYRS